MNWKFWKKEKKALESLTLTTDPEKGKFSLGTHPTTGEFYILVSKEDFLKLINCYINWGEDVERETEAFNRKLKDWEYKIENLKQGWINAEAKALAIRKTLGHLQED